MSDQYISVEHLLIGILSVSDSVSQLLKDNGLNIKELRKIITELRKVSKINSESAESTFNALERYALNLNSRAREGKLDPVIGSD